MDDHWGVRMTKPKKILIAFFLMLLNASFVGCAQHKLVQNPYVQNRNAQNINCRLCHSPYGSEEARDFSSIYNNPASHHSVGVSYPLGPNGFPNFNAPTGKVIDAQSEDIFFFDRNGNGEADNDEVQLYGTDVRVTVECASCHKKHGDLPTPENPPNAYLRIANIGSALCITCHRQ